MAKFTKSVEKKSADKVLVKSAGGVQKKNGQNKPAVAPAASKPNAAVKAAIIAEAKTPKPVKAAAASSAKPTDKAGKLCAPLFRTCMLINTCSFLMVMFVFVVCTDAPFFIFHTC